MIVCHVLPPCSGRSPLQPTGSPAPVKSRLTPTILKSSPMTRATLRNGLRLIIAVAVMLSALPFLRAAPSMHELGAAQVVESLVSATLLDGIGHGHSHDDDDPDHRPGHGPEHKDHSHVTMGLAAPPASLIAPDGKFLRRWEPCRSTSHLSFRLDRPPCPSFVA